MWALLGSIVLSFALVPAALARPVNLPGALAGGVEVCRPYRCFTTPADRETATQVLSYQDGMANVRVGKETVVADPNDVVLKLKGCSLTLRSHLARRFCPGLEAPGIAFSIRTNKSRNGTGRPVSSLGSPTVSRRRQPSNLQRCSTFAGCLQRQIGNG